MTVESSPRSIADSPPDQIQEGLTPAPSSDEIALFEQDLAQKNIKDTLRHVGRLTLLTIQTFTQPAFGKDHPKTDHYVVHPPSPSLVHVTEQEQGQTYDEYLKLEKLTRKFEPKRQWLRDHIVPASDKQPRYWSVKASERIHKTHKIGAVLGVAATLVTHNYIAGQNLWSDTEPSFIRIAQAENEVHDLQATFMFAGFGNRNANVASYALDETLVKYGAVYSLEYDNSGINVADIGEKLIEIIDERGLTHISLIGHSMGGLVAAAVAAYVAEHRPEVTIDFLGLDGTPTGMDVVAGSEQKRGYFLNTALTDPRLSWLNGVYTRGAIEFSQRIDKWFDCDKALCIDGEGAMWAAEEAYKRMTSQAASNKLLGAQFNFIVVSDLHASLEALKKFQPEGGPVVVYMRPDDPSRDRTTITDQSELHLKEFGRELNLQIIVVRFTDANARHANPGEAPGQYNQGWNRVSKLVESTSYNDYYQAQNKDPETGTPMSPPPITLTITG